MSTSQPFRSVSVGYGGTFRYSPESVTVAEQIEHVGTEDCETCVGVFFKVDDNKFFLAHINVCFLHRDSEDVTHEATPAQGQEIRIRMFGHISQQAADHGWTYTKQQMRDSLVLICPHEMTDDLQTELQTGYYVVRALDDFLGCNGTLTAKDHAHGFVVSLTGGSVTYLTHDRLMHSHESAESQGWHSVPETNVPSWEWSLGTGGWEQSP